MGVVQKCSNSHETAAFYTEQHTTHLHNHPLQNYNLMCNIIFKFDMSCDNYFLNWRNLFEFCWMLCNWFDFYFMQYLGTKLGGKQEIISIEKSRTAKTGNKVGMTVQCTTPQHIFFWWFPCYMEKRSILGIVYQTVLCYHPYLVFLLLPFYCLQDSWPGEIYRWISV